jgi:hypothetical protein
MIARSGKGDRMDRDIRTMDDVMRLLETALFRRDPTPEAS